MFTMSGNDLSKAQKRDPDRADSTLKKYNLMEESPCVSYAASVRKGSPPQPLEMLGPMLQTGIHLKRPHFHDLCIKTSTFNLQS